MATLAPSFLIGSSSFLQVSRKTIKSRLSSKFGSCTVELAALDRLEKSPKTYNGRNLVATLATSFLIGSSSFLQVTRTCINAWTSLNFHQISPLTKELSALECLNKRHKSLWPL